MASILYSPIHDWSARMRDIFLSPVVTAPLFFAATYAPNAVRQLILTIASKAPISSLQRLSPEFDMSPLTDALRVVFVLSVVRALNKTLNRLAANSWRLTRAKGWDWPTEVAVVTGGSSGIGKDIVEGLVALGVRGVAVLDVQPLPKCLEAEPRVRYYQCDITSSDAVRETADAVRRDLGHPSILVNNAGITSPVSILNISEKFLRKIFDVNTVSHWFLAQQFLPHMIKADKGHVVTVASLASYVALATAADYSATKASALAFHESLTCELKHVYKAPNVLTTVVHPNFVRTPLVNDFAGHLEKSGVRMLTSRDIADPIVAQIKSRYGGQLILPRGATPISGIRGWPNWLQELVRDTIGRSSLA
ncbi:hypothetical protein F5Y17DRAFT_427590 [Xylariaceae sp. FL0594]|nr:hypothetical protein F5Y17DRAFT_427590 [Xylariaceae sp. FL0594]